MDYSFMPKLQEIALARIAISLWNLDDVREELSRLNFESEMTIRRKNFKVILLKVKEKVQQLYLPSSLETKLMYFIEIISQEILIWKEYHTDCKYLSIDVPIELHWTLQGTVDLKETALLLVKNENINITKRFKLACIYCLEDEILALWSKITAVDKRSFFHEEGVGNNDLELVWIYDIMRKIAELNKIMENRWELKCSICQYAFECAVSTGNKVATKYFFGKLTTEEKKESLKRAATNMVRKRSSKASSYSFHCTDFPKEHYADVLFFLLMQMKNEERQNLFEENPFEILECFLDWPLQGLFMTVANCMWDHLSGQVFYRLLDKIIQHVQDRKDFDYKELFRNFWTKSQDGHRNFVACCITSVAYLITCLSNVDDIKNIKMILKCVTTGDKEVMILSVIENDICESLVYSKKLDLLKIIVEDCISTKDAIFMLKEKLKERNLCCHSMETEKKEFYNKFCRLIDDLAQKYE